MGSAIAFGQLAEDVVENGHVVRREIPDDVVLAGTGLLPSREMTRHSRCRQDLRQYGRRGASLLDGARIEKRMIGEQAHRLRCWGGPARVRARLAFASSARGFSIEHVLTGRDGAQGHVV